MVRAFLTQPLRLLQGPSDLPFRRMVAFLHNISGDIASLKANINSNLATTYTGLEAFESRACNSNSNSRGYHRVQQHNLFLDLGG